MSAIFLIDMQRQMEAHLSKSSASLSAYGGQELRVVGEADVEVAYQNQVFQDTVVVVEARGAMVQKLRGA